MNKLAFNIKDLRIKRSLSQAELAQKVFTTKSTISKWESGAQVPTIDSLRLLSDTLKVPMYVLLGEEPTSFRDKTWAWFGKTIFWIGIWSTFDISLGAFLSLFGWALVICGIAFPIIKPFSILGVDLKNNVFDYIEAIKMVGNFLASPIFAAVFISSGYALIMISKTYIKFSTKVFWKKNIKLLDKKFKLPKIKKKFWIMLGVSSVIGFTLIIISIILVAIDGSWDGRMW